MDGLLLNIFLIEKIATLRAEFGRILRIRRNPTAFVAFIQGRIRRLLCAAVSAELALVYSATAAGPALRSCSLLGLAAFSAELAGITSVTARAGPASLRLFLGLATAGTEFAGVAALATGAGPTCGSGTSHTLRCTLLGITLRRIALRGTGITTLRRITLRATGIATRATGVTALRRIHLLIDGIHHVSALISGHAHAHEARHCRSEEHTSELQSPS